MLEVFTVHDSKSEGYLQPFFTLTEGLAIRMFKTSALDPNHQFHVHAEDFTLFHLGTYDESTGLFNLHDTPRPLFKAIQFAVVPHAAADPQTGSEAASSGENPQPFNPNLHLNNNN